VQLYLAGNGLGPQGASYLFSALARNNTLRSLFVVRWANVASVDRGAGYAC
jgi:hypothetical protein